MKQSQKAKETITFVAVAKTNYHYYRNWVKDILTKGKIKKFRFKKNEDSYDGIILVDSKELVLAKNVLDKYKKENKDTVDMWSN